MYQNPEEKRKDLNRLALNKMIGGIRERRAKAKAEIEARKKANDLDAKARKAAVPPFGHDLVVSDDLVIESQGGPSAGDILTDLGQGADIKHPGAKTVEERCQSSHGRITFDAKESFAFKSQDENTAPPLDRPLNLVARERLERQISDLIDNANQALKERTFLTRDALDILEMARNTAYTEPMGEVAVTIHEAARRLSEVEPQFGKVANALGNLATEIKQSEQAREVSK